MTPEQASIVQQTFATVAPHARDVAAHFYSRLFELDPDLRPLFKASLEEQGQKLMQSFAVVVAAIKRFDDVAPAVRDLGARHVEYGVQETHYDTVGAALLDTLEAGLGDAFTPAVREAWAAAFSAIAETMMAGARRRPGARPHPVRPT